MDGRALASRLDVRVGTPAHEVRLGADRNHGGADHGKDSQLGMNSVGIDLHRHGSHIPVIDELAELSLSKRIVNDRETFLELLGDLDGESQIAVEATYGWEWLAELLEDSGYDFHLAHPLRTRAIAAA